MAHKADREYIWHFFDEGADRGESIDAVRHAFGFCAEHIEMLRRIEIDGMKSTLGISTMFADTFAGIVEDIDLLKPGEDFRRERCPACANRDELLRVNAEYLLDDLATTHGRRAAFETSPGLCFAHFELVWGIAATVEDRQLILDVQRRSAGRLLQELRVRVDSGAEDGAWERAIHLTAGWPPPARSAAEPERPAD
ncbi:MAG TPA: hypothetical protein VJ741_16540 [Solirubrobacteraceae bacterium]|nr:hypothetical protein [Solirubrobacteraceae bacterium]